MNQLVNNIKNIPGVIGVAIFKDNGNLVAFDFPSAYDKNLLDHIGQKFQPIKEILPRDEGEIVYLCWEFENLLGFYYPVDKGWVNVISDESIPMPVFSLTMTAISKKLPGLLETAPEIKEKEIIKTTPPTPSTPLSPLETQEIIPQENIDKLEKLLTVYLGPASHVILKRTAAHAGYELNNIPQNFLKTLLDEIIDKMPGNKQDDAVEKAGQIFPGYTR
jgi:hypothetical protein